MPCFSVCPTPEEVRRLVIAGGTPQEIEELAVHLEGCDACGERLDRDLAEDPTLAGLADSTAVSLPSSEQLQVLRERVAQLRPIARIAGSDRTEPLEKIEQTLIPQLPFDDTAVSHAFLRPAEQAGELGRLGNYRVVQQIGVGGMGIVFLAEDLTLHRKVALKTMLPALASNAQVKERFLREARAAASVEHENIVSIFQVGEEQGVPFLAMPLLKGEPLDERLKRQGQLELTEAIRIAAEIAAGLAAAHDQGLIHRDIKPANIWLEGESGKVKLLDFGLARAQADTAHLTQAGAIVGTPAFMAPEQAQGEVVDPRADLFSLGAVLYLMLTGKRPFPGSNAVNVIASLVLNSPSAPQSVNPQIPRPVSELTMQLLEKDPAKRPASAQVTVSRLRGLLETSAPTQSMQFSPTVPARSTPAGSRGGTSGKSKGLYTRLAVAGTVVMLLFLAAVVYRIQTNTGELVLEAQDDMIEVTIKQAGQKPVVLVIDKNSKKAIELTAVGGEIEARELPDGLRFKTQRFELVRGGKPVFTADMLLAKATIREPAPQALAQPAVAAGAPPVYVETPEFTAWKTEVAALPVEQQIAAVSKKLQELNPGFDGRLWGTEGQPTPTIKDGAVSVLALSVDHVTDISPLRVFAKIHSLELRGSWDRGRLADLTPLQGLRPRILRLIGLKARDLDSLREMQLKGLELTNTPVSDLSPLKGMPLTWLMCGGTKVEDLTPLKGLPLEFLECPDCRIKDFSPLEKCPLREMKIWTTRPEGQAAAYETLRTVKSLATVNYKPVDVFFAEIPGMVELERTIKKLRELNPDYDGVVLESKIEREHVTELRFASSDITNLAPLRELKELKKLELIGVSTPAIRPKLTDISQLEGMSLTSLSLQAQPIVDISPLKGMPLKWLSLAQTNVKDLTPLTGMPLILLHVNSTPVLDLAPLAGMPLQHLAFTFHPDIKTEVLPSLKSLEQINNKPAKAFFEDLPVELETYQAVQQLRELNRVDPRNPVDIKVEKTNVELLVYGVGDPADIEPLKPLKTLTILRCPHLPMTDLKPLAGKPLKVLEIPGCRVSDLSPLKGMPLTKLDIGDAPVTDLSPLAESLLVELIFKGIQPERDGAVLRSIKTLQQINGRPVADFWKDADKQQKQ